MRFLSRLNIRISIAVLSSFEMTPVVQTSFRSNQQWLSLLPIFVREKSPTAPWCMRFLSGEKLYKRKAFVHSFQTTPVVQTSFRPNQQWLQLLPIFVREKSPTAPGCMRFLSCEKLYKIKAFVHFFEMTGRGCRPGGFFKKSVSLKELNKLTGSIIRNYYEYK
jgi:hypothetical protein